MCPRLIKMLNQKVKNEDAAVHPLIVPNGDAVNLQLKKMNLL
jgi:hypothetical protein